MSGFNVSIFEIISNDLSLFNIQTGIESVRGDTLSIKLQNAWLLLQTAINCVVDQNLDKLSTDKQPGIKQVINISVKTQNHLICL